MIRLLSCVLLLGYGGATSDGDRTIHPNLPLGDINLVVLTDTHSWLGGHGEKEDNDINYGDVLSFYQILGDQVRSIEESDPDKHKHDLFFVMNGDWIDGTGLAMNGDPSHLIPLLRRMPWDAVNVGNHELFKRSVVEDIIRPGGIAEWWGPRYLSSNILKTQDKEPIGNKFHVLTGRHSTTLVFGFLFNMVGFDPIVTVERVQDAINEEWFKEALQTITYDAILVLAHMDHDDSLVHVILERIRALVDSDMPVQFITGHTHYRGFSRPDNYSSSVEAGRYLDTVGFVSIPTQNNLRAAAHARKQATGNALAPPSLSAGNQRNPAYNATDTFQYSFIDARYQALQAVLGVDEVVTPDGIELSELIENVQQELGLFNIVGCAEKNYYLNLDVDQPNSLWGLFCQNVIPHAFPWSYWSQRKAEHMGKNPKVVVMEKKSWRYDLYAKELTMDEVIAVSPYNRSLYMFPEIPGSVIAELNASLNAHSKVAKLPNWVMCPSPASEFPQPTEPGGSNELYDLVVSEFSINRIRQTLEAVWPNASPEESYVPESLPLADHTTTSVWLQFFSETETCQTDKKGNERYPVPNTKSGHHTSSGTPSKAMGSFIGDPLDNNGWVVFAVATVLLAFVLTGVCIRKKPMRSQVYTSELATVEPSSEFSDEQEMTIEFYKDDKGDIL